MSNIPLSVLPKGSKAIIVGILGGRGLITRLMQMGLTPGAMVEVVENQAGPIVIRVRGTTIALGRGIASKIIVNPL